VHCISTVRQCYDSLACVCSIAYRGQVSLHALLLECCCNSHKHCCTVIAHACAVLLHGICVTNTSRQTHSRTSIKATLQTTKRAAPSVTSCDEEEVLCPCLHEALLPQRKQLVDGLHVRTRRCQRVPGKTANRQDVDMMTITITFCCTHLNQMA
jgi:hypothetical protein